MGDQLCGNCGWSYPVPDGELKSFVRCAVDPPRVFMTSRVTEDAHPVAYDPRCKKNRPGCRYWKERVQEGES